MRARALALATEDVAESAAREHLEAGGSALGAVLAGFFAAAGEGPGVLFAPLSVLVAGVGQGARAFDGRSRQPGLGIKRPRGFPSGEAIPEAARIAVPTALSAAIVAHAYGGEQGLRAVVRYGIEAAERASAEQRKRLLERVAQIGAATVTEASYRRPLLRLASSSEGGLLTPSDLEPPTDVDVPALARDISGSRSVVVPWAHEKPHDLAASGEPHGIVAVDVHGVFAGAVYRNVESGVWLEEHELRVPELAVPVRRGVTRLAPGARLPSPAPVVIRVDDALRPIEIALSPDGDVPDASGHGRPRLVLRRDPATRFVAAEGR